MTASFYKKLLKQPLYYFAPIIILFIIGYVMNIITMFTSIDMSNPVLAVRVIGVFIPPIGAVFGYF